MIQQLGAVMTGCSAFAEHDKSGQRDAVFGKPAGIETRDPAFGMEAVWIEPGQREHAQTLGYTVVDASTVVATHLSNVIQTHAPELPGHVHVNCVGAHTVEQRRLNTPEDNENERERGANGQRDLGAAAAAPPEASPPEASPPEAGQSSDRLRRPGYVTASSLLSSFRG